MNKGVQAALIVVTVALLVSWIEPRYPNEQWLQHLPTVPALIGIAVVARRRALSPASLHCILAFLLLHVIGARWVYTMTPYDEWLRSWFGADTHDWFGWERNHYDRFVHLMFGVLAMVPVAEASRRRLCVSPGVAKLIAFLFVAGLSAIYEVFEWGLAVTAAPETAERYNGQQGDLWDAQKDMALACLGALLILPWTARRGDHAGQEDA